MTRFAHQPRSEGSLVAFRPRVQKETPEELRAAADEAYRRNQIDLTSFRNAYEASGVKWFAADLRAQEIDMARRAK